MFEWLGPLQLFQLDTMLILTLLVVSIHLTFRVGIFSLAPMGFAAVGGYTAALVSTKTELPFLVGLIGASALAAAIGAVFAPVVLRLRGIYMALGTLALAQAIVVLIRISDFTNGPNGISGISLSMRTEYVVGALLVTFLVLQLSHRSYFGRAATAIRLDERTAEGLGINVFRVRFVGFTVAAAVAGLAGAMEAHRTTVISPDQYGFGTLVILFTYVLVGGAGHWLGPVLVTWVLTVLRDKLEVTGSYWQDIIYGVLLVLIMIVAPYGLSDRGVRHALMRRWRRLRTRSRATAPVTGPDSERATADQPEVEVAGR